jgi:hypothetical protein
MELDVGSKMKTKPGEWGSQPVLAHRCSACGASFANAKALESHRKAKHKTRAAFTSMIGSSRVCPCCHVEFSTRTRLLAHISEKRNRGGRKYSCNMLFAAGLVRPLGEDELSSAYAADTEARTLARKAGHTVPITENLAKRPKVGTTVLEQQLNMRKRNAAGVVVPTLPSNAVQLDKLRPLKRARAKTSQEDVILQHVSCTAG